MRYAESDVDVVRVKNCDLLHHQDKIFLTRFEYLKEEIFDEFNITSY